MSNPSGFKITDSTAGWNQADFDDVFVRNDIFVEGNLWLWGTNDNGQLGDNTVTNRSSPVQTVSGGTNWKQVSVAVSAVGSAAIKTDGTLWMWGTNDYGQLGDNTVTNKSSPVQTVSGGTNWKQVSAGWRYAAAIKTDGTLWLWGANDFAQLGDNTLTNRSSPVQTVSGGTNWKQVSCGLSHTAAVKTDGTLWLWGTGINGQLGDNTNVGKSSPVQTVSGGNNWKQVALGGNITAAIKTDGSLWTWGRNEYGQLGDNTIVSKSSPVQTISGGTNWKQVACEGYDVSGFSFMTAIKTDGTLWSWGYNANGTLGDNTTTNRSSPVQTVSGGTNWSKVSNACAIKTDGTLWLWGYATQGSIGDNTLINRSSPVQTVTGGTNWRSLSIMKSVTFGAIRG